LQAFAIGRSGDILVLDMGEPVRVADLAKTLLRLSGKPPQEFKFIGLRPGEKLFEELFYPDERVLPSPCAKIVCTESTKVAWSALKHGLDELYVAVSLGNRAPILAQLQQIVPQFSYDGSVPAKSMEMWPSSQSGSLSSSDAPLESRPLVDRTHSPHRTWRKSSLLEPSVGGPGD
jgi:hypothetical protein